VDDVSLLIALHYPRTDDHHVVLSNPEPLADLAPDAACTHVPILASDAKAIEAKHLLGNT
jgi:hypothetical protein